MANDNFCLNIQDALNSTELDIPKPPTGEAGPG
jgi:hypothetical protein